MSSSFIAERLALEQGTLRGQGKRRVALVYPSPYPVAMASLGFQTIYRELNSLPDTVAERAFLPESPLKGPLRTYESESPAADFSVVAFSIAYELELAGLFACLAAMGVPPRNEQRQPRDPLVVVGGPLTFANPLPVTPFADLILVGEAEGALSPLLDQIWTATSRDTALAHLAGLPGFYVPKIHGMAVPPVRRANDADLPARAAITTPASSLPDMFLVEVARGCSRPCEFCVMRRRREHLGSVRVVDKERVLAAIPISARRVGLVGAAVCDHPQLTELVREVVGAGREIGLSSLRADRLTPELAGLLALGGNRTLTVAADGASERLRRELHKGIRASHLLRAAELAAEARMAQLKVYVMVGSPTETDADLDELADLGGRLAAAAGKRTRVTLAVSPFVPKHGTPLADAEFVGIREADRRVERLRRSLQAKRVAVRAASSRWAWVEAVLAQGDADTGLLTLAAWRQGGTFAAYKRAFSAQAGIPAPKGIPNQWTLR